MIDLARMFPDEESAREWFEAVIWPDGRQCPRCEGTNTYETRTNGSGVPYRCRDCKRYFSVRTGTAIQSSKLPLQKWVGALFLEMIGLKGVSSMKLHRDLGITQKHAWHMLYRIRTVFAPAVQAAFKGPVEVDEMFVGGLARGQETTVP